MIGNPVKAIPRYANFAMSGFKGESPYLYGKGDTFAYQMGKHPLLTGAGILGGIALHSTLFPSEDAYVESIPPQQTILIQPQGTPSYPYPVTIPSLDEEERKKQREYLERKVATDLITMQGLGGQYVR